MRFILASKKKAQSLIEYALILAMVAVVAIAALQLLGNNVGTALRSSANAVHEGATNAGENACKSMGDGFEWANDKCTWTGNNTNNNTNNNTSGD